MRTLLIWLLMTLLLYPLYVAGAIALDTVAGPQQFLTHLLFDSKSALLRNLIMDGLRMLPWAALVALIALTALRLGQYRAGVALATAAIGGVVAALVLTPWAGVAMGISLLLVSLGAVGVRPQ